MKTFRDYLSEEVMPSALVADGSIDIDNPAVRDNINHLLSSAVASCPTVTPYNALMKVRKVLAYFAIQLPRRSYMEGKHGVEVWEIHQFGDKMGMNDQGEFIKSVPAKYFLFFHYHMFGSMYSVHAKIVDQEQLDSEIDMAEVMIKEDAETMKHLQRAVAPKEPMHDLGDSTEGAEQAVSVSMRHKDKKLSVDSLDEEQIDETNKENKAKKKKWEADKGTKHFKTMGYPAALNQLAKSDSATLRHVGRNSPFKEETISEKAPPGAKFERMVKHIKKSYGKGGLTDVEKAKAYGAAWSAYKRQMDEDYRETPAEKAEKKEMSKIAKYAIAKGADIKKLPPSRKKKLEEVSKETLASYIPKAAHSVGLMTAKRIHKGFQHPEYEKDLAKHAKRMRGISTAAEKLAKEETQIDEISDETVRSHTAKVLAKLPKQIAKKNYGLGKEKETARDWLDKRNKGSVLKMKREVRKFAAKIGEEALDELSRETLQSYRKKVEDQHLPRHDAKARKHTRGHTTAGKKLGMDPMDATIDTIEKTFTPRYMKNLGDRQTKARESNPGFKDFKNRKRD